MTTLARCALLAGLALALIVPTTQALLLAQEENGNGEDAPPATEATEDDNGEDAPAEAPSEAENGEAEQDAAVAIAAMSFPEQFVVAQEFQTSLTLSILLDDNEFDRVRSEQGIQSRVRIEGIEVDDNGAIRGARLTVLAREVNRRTDGGARRRSESELLGHRFDAVVDEDGEIRVHDLQGDEQTGEAAEVVAAKIRTLQSGFPLLRFLADQPRPVGEEIGLEASYAAGFFDLDGTFKVEELAVTPREQGAEVAIYDIRVKLAGEIAADMPAELTLTGELHVNHATGWPRRLQVSGPIKVETDRQYGEQTLALRGTGTATLGADY